MATVYSLICWGGLTGKSVSGATSTDILTLTNHGLRVGTKVIAQSTVSGVVAGTTYYAYPITASTFYLYDTLANAQAGGTTGRIDITATTAFVLKSDLVANPATALSAYGLNDLSRWDSTRIYDAFRNYLSARLTIANQSDDEIVEFGEAFDDIYTFGNSTAGFTGASLTFISSINGYRSAAFHGGIPAYGYRMIVTNADNPCVNLNSYNIILDGLEFCTNTATNGTSGIIIVGSTGFNSKVRNNIFRALGTGTQPGLNLAQTIECYNNIVMGFLGTTYGGIYSTNGSGVTCYNNIVTKCDIGIRSNGSQGLFFNNISVGNNVANYSTSPQALTFRAAGNIGSTADKYPVTVAVGTQTVTVSGMPASVTLQTNCIVYFSSTGSLPTVGGVALNPNTPYYVLSISGSTFQISTSFNGSRLTFDGAGSGTHSISLVWGSAATAPLMVDFTTPNDVFKDWANNDFRPAGTGSTPSAKALQVESAVDIYGVNLTTDIAGNERPNYNNGGFEANDVGPFEYDHGYGPHPASTTVTFDGVAANSEIRVYNSTGSELAGIESCAANQALTWAIPSPATVRIVIIHPDYRIKEFTYTSISGNQFIPSGQDPDKWYSNPV